MSDTKPIDAGSHDGRVATAEVVVATDAGVRFLDRDVELAGRAVTAIAAGPDGPLALVDGTEIHARATGGTWRLGAGLDGGAGRCLIAHRGEVWVGGTQARLWRVSGDRLEPVSSFDRAPTHEEWKTPWGGPPTSTRSPRTARISTSAST